ncbi:MAG TPA: Gfo/Idh/MocA family oxidoreductase [Dehalococcoidia bacterium]|jgi:predicted dehydrogenase|nr:Gfo/Idh/MocA family oxidoreductase [Dehalococcoidia bacterium]
MGFALCVLGCGQFARTFAAGVAPLRGEIDLFFASRDLKRAQAYSESLQGCGAYGSYEEPAADPKIDALYVCTPHYLHLEHVVLAASAGKHVLVEKPIACDLKAAAQIIEDSSKAGITLMVAENVRFMAAVRRCKEIADSGTLGDLRLVQLQEEAPFRPGGWRSNAGLNGGGVFIDGGIHKVHFLRYLLGEPSHIYATTLPPAMSGHEGEDGLVMMARWSNGAVGLINHSWVSSSRTTPRWVSVSGTKGRIYLEICESWLRLEYDNSEETIQFDEDHSGITPMVREFLSSIEEGREPETSGQEGLRDLALVLKAYDSIQTGTSLHLP